MEEILDRELRLLILEDVPSDAELTERELRKAGIRFTARRVVSREGFAGALERESFDLILSDYNLPAFDGVAALRLAREKCPDVPFLIVSGRIGEETAIEALKAGAIDYILKDNLVRLAPSIRRALRESADQKRLRESEKKFRTLFEESKDVIYITGLDDRLTEINPAGVELFGYTKEELLSLDVAAELYCDLGGRERFLRTLYEQGYVRDLDVRMKRKNGEMLQVLKSASLVRDGQGEVTGYRGIVHDVTGRKRLEQQLLQSQKMESVGLLAGGVAHDFNNLLTIISGYSQLIQERFAERDEMLGMCIGQVMEATARAVEMTRNLLAFSRKQVINPRPVSVNDIVSKLGKLLTRIIGEDIELGTSLAGETMMAMADSGQIDQVLINLATNARDAMPNGGGLRIGTERVELDEETARRHGLDRGGGYARVSVADTGQGMDREMLERIFEPFYTTKEAGKGTGLGLSIIYGIVKQHNGAVAVESEPGRGATFTVYLPLIEAEDDEAQAREAHAPARGTETLLLAEDDSMVRTYMQKILELAGYAVIAAKDGAEAVEKFREQRERIALVVCDVVMPKKNGREVYDEIRAVEPRARFLFVSGYNDEIIHTKGILLEDIDCLVKPVDRQALLARIREVIERDR